LKGSKLIFDTRGYHACIVTMIMLVIMAIFINTTTNINCNSIKEVRNVNDADIPKPSWNRKPFFTKMISLNLTVSNMVAEHADNERMNFSEAVRHLIYLGHLYRYKILEEEEKDFKKILQEIKQRESLIKREKEE